MPHTPNLNNETIDSSKEVARHTGIEVLQPGLIPVYTPSRDNLSHHNNVAADVGGKAYEEGSGPPVKRIWGLCLRRVTFWLVLGMVGLTIVIVGVAVGLGVAMGRGGTDGDPQPSSTTADSAGSESGANTSDTSSPSATSTSSTTDPSSTSTSTSSNSNNPSPSSICPSGNNTLLTRGLGSTTYRILCDSDFTGPDKQTLASTVLPTFNDCLDLCSTMNYFQERGDVGCTYNVAGTGDQTPGTCWCLGGEGKRIFENVGNEVAVPVDGDGEG
ncbi:hypothetical protein FQN54_004924 [Arachnomyces sp. PD_36]|nr:hypothetical protein FQN54_004924 [Arachnomyces sp. PD_36]